jgi:chaperone required for assembly of F1-ATPase
VTPSLKKRFWKEASVVEIEDGYSVELDGRKLRTPSKAPLNVTYREIADAIASEWMAQEELVDPTTMPATRMANSVIDKVIVNQDAIVDMLSEYAGSDLMCYRATTPQSLIEEQAAAWDPILDWSAAHMKAPMHTTSGVMFVEQPAQSVEVYRARLKRMNPYQLAGVHDLITISGSVVISMALITNHLNLEQAWSTAIVDESWQEKQWGVDEEAQEAIEKKRQDFEFAYNFWKSASS